MDQPEKQNEQHQAFRLLDGAGLVEIRLDQFADRIADVKRIVLGRLRDLLDLNSGIQERDSAAYSLGTLAGLEIKLRTNTPKPAEPDDK